MSNQEKLQRLNNILGNIFGYLVLVGCILLIGAGIIIRCTSNDDNQNQIEINPVSLPTISKEAIAVSVMTMKDYGALSATASQDGGNVSLKLILPPDTPIEKAKERGDDFIRQIIANSGVDGRLRKEIGQTKLNYRVLVFYPDNKLIAEGTKDANSWSVRWGN